MKVPIDTLPLFPVLNAELVTFLKKLTPVDWQRRTVARLWKVKDVAAHLLDGNLRRIAVHRDSWLFAPDEPITSYEGLVRYLNELNADWVKAARRLSPQLLIEMIEQTNKEALIIFQNLKPFDEAVFPVAWAGEDKSQNWFDLAREYTERWLHQQQIRDALGDAGIMTEQLYRPFLDIFMHAWPICMKDMGDVGFILKTSVTGPGGGEWYVKKNNEGKWQLINDPAGEPVVAETVIEGNVAWKLFSKSVRRKEIENTYSISGNQQLGERVLEMVSVMA